MTVIRAAIRFGFIKNMLTPVQFRPYHRRNSDPLPRFFDFYSSFVRNLICWKLSVEFRAFMKLHFQSLFRILDFLPARSSRKSRITCESLLPCKPRRSSTSVSRSAIFRTHLQKKSVCFTTLFQANFISMLTQLLPKMFNLISL